MNNPHREAFFEMDEVNDYLMKANKTLNLNGGDVLKSFKNSDDFYAHRHVIS